MGLDCISVLFSEPEPLSYKVLITIFSFQSNFPKTTKEQNKEQLKPLCWGSVSHQKRPFKPSAVVPLTLCNLFSLADEVWQNRNSALSCNTNRSNPKSMTRKMKQNVLVLRQHHSCWGAGWWWRGGGEGCCFSPHLVWHQGTKLNWWANPENHC